MSKSAPFPTSTAALLTSHDFTTAEATAWTTYLPGVPAVDVLTRAQSWRNVGMSGEDAVAWDRADFQPQEAYHWFFLGATPRGADFVLSRIDLGDTQRWLGSGLSADEMVLAVGSGCRDVKSALALIDKIDNGDLDRGTLRLQADLDGIDIRTLG